MKRRFWVLKFFKFLFIAAALATVAGFVVMSLWNWLVPALFAGPVVTFWQALGLLLLSKILFGGFRGGSGKHWKHRQDWKYRMRERMEKMSPEQRERLRKRWGNRCGWEDELQRKESNNTENL